jgi:ATP-dependent DNA helicase RecG
MISNEFVSALLKEKEGEQMAFFQNFSTDQIAATVCAFLNTKGGRILISGNSPGVVIDSHVLEGNFQSLRKYIYESIIPESLIGIRKEDINDGQLVLIDVIEGNKKPYSLNNRSYVRIGYETKVAEENDMANLIRSRRIDDYSWERSPVLDATLDDLDINLIRRTIVLANSMERSSKFNEDEPLNFLSYFQLFRNNQFTNAAIVLFAKEPTYFLPQCHVRIIEFGKGKTSDRYENTVLFQNNLFHGFEEIENYLRKNLPIISEFNDTDWRRQDRLKYPIKAMDEAVINAMMHRDYSDATGEVFIGIYPDKIEIINSGELPDSLKEKDLKQSHRSIPPNPGITHIVYLCGMIEKVGRGTILINEAFEDLGLESPHWVSKHGATTLTLYGVAKKIEINERMHRFLTHLQPEERFSREEYQAYFHDDISERTARMDIGKLLEGEWIKKINDGAFTRYIKINKELPDVAG